MFVESGVSEIILDEARSSGSLSPPSLGSHSRICCVQNMRWERFELQYECEVLLLTYEAA